jgi:hypothetical protein
MDDKQSRSEARLVVFFTGGVCFLSSRSTCRRRGSFLAGLPVLLFFLGLLCAFLFPFCFVSLSGLVARGLPLAIVRCAPMRVLYLGGSILIR